MDVEALPHAATTTTTPRVTPQLEIPWTREYHAPPRNDNNNNNDDYYRDNPTPFGAILRGDDRARILDETNNLLAFVDRSPQSPTLHALIIPKRYIPTIRDLSPPTDLSLLCEMEQLGQRLVSRYQCPAEYRMVFHVPPYNTVDHLHLHVLCNRDLSLFGRTVKYVYDTPWCISLPTLIRQQQEQLSRNRNSPNSKT